jgi:UDP-N-acetyl-D-mannosaminuronic acid transferase (WecB/TagA/CpsF family)
MTCYYRKNASEAVQIKYQRHRHVAVFLQNGCSKEVFDLYSNALIKAINSSWATILFTGFGAPLQEKWIGLHRHEFKPLILKDLGRLFDCNSETIKGRQYSFSLLVYEKESVHSK